MDNRSERSKQFDRAHTSTPAKAPAGNSKSKILNFLNRTDVQADTLNFLNTVSIA
jgi:hypothetical protein